MGAALLIARREAASFFRLPIGWVVIALYLALSASVFSLVTLRPGEPATLREFFRLSSWLLMFLSPAVSMRLIAEERRAGTFETLMTSPVLEWQVALGKLAGAFLFLLCLLAPTLAFPLVLEAVGDPDWGAIAAGYTGLLLLGLFYLSIGAFCSALTSNQIVAFLSALFLVLLLRIASLQGAQALGPPLDSFLYPLSVDLRVADFGKGVIDTAHAAFFLAASAWFLTLTTVALEARRWR